jgi:hypothetical protein
LIHGGAQLLNSGIKGKVVCINEEVGCRGFIKADAIEDSEQGDVEKSGNKIAT